MLRLTFFIACAFACAGIATATETKVTVKIEKSSSPATTGEDDAPFTGNRPAVDVAVLLDTSNSMDGLINQAKNQLWTIVQQFAKAKKRGQTPVLRVALLEYGNTRLPASEGFIRQVVPLTDDLDKLSQALFSLTTSGGDEYCGQVIDEAITRLDWADEPNGYRAVFIAGNEPFTQGEVNYRDACKRAIEKGIVVNTIHCGNQRAGIEGKWKHGAELAEGEFFNIDQDRVVVHIDCPQDRIIIQLNAELNKTYLWYGAPKQRLEWAENQLAQDRNAEGLSSGALAGRAVAKAGKAYSNRRRDLVDTLEEDREILSKVKTDELPEPLRAMAPEEQVAYVQQMASERKELQQKIAQLATEREAYLAQERQRLAGAAGGETLGDAVVAAVQKQLSASGFEME